jgi:tripartite-type tricarboxylate transporter receptor subunit TctC
MLVAPAGTPPAVLAKLQSEVAKALARPDTIATLQAEGSAPLVTTPQEAARLLTSEQERWASVVRSGSVKLD